MTGADLYTLVCDTLLGGIQLNPVAFYQLLNFVKTLVEEDREWLNLRAIDTSKTWLTSDTYITNGKALPVDFSHFAETVIYTVDSAGNKGPELKEILQGQRLNYKDSVGYFYVDYGTSTLYLCGTPDKQYTLHIPYIQFSPDITANTSWVFPARFQIGLAHALASIHKSGIDFDDINSRMATQNNADFQRLLSAMRSWDSMRQVNALPDDIRQSGSRETI